MIYFQLFYEYLKIGLFSVGGGLATLPFLIALTYKYDWFDQPMLADMVAVSESTPGPMGVNIATYAGYTTAGIFGSICATTGLMLPSIVIIVILAKFMNKFKNSPHVEAVFSGLRPASLGLIGVAGYEVVKIALLNINLYESTKNFMDLFDLKALIIFAVLFYFIIKFKKHPILYIVIAAVTGIVLKL